MKIFVDYDTTLVNLIDPWIRWINEKYNVKISSTDINRWYFLGEVFGKEADDFWRSEQYNHYTNKDIFQPYDGAVEFFHTLEDLFGKENVYIISSTRDHHVEEKIKHARYHFGIDKNQFIPVSKEKYTLTEGNILIDDYPLHIMKHIHYNNDVGIVFNHHNRFAWCYESNYHLDATLIPFVHITKNENFNIATSYTEVLHIINKRKLDVFSASA